ncbi:MAG: hypothetical protein MJB57_10290 [Gemmatimonadetes bacterium]|nr:hypothetical protein [Gemmatimonadota bacterium]
MKRLFFSTALLIVTAVGFAATATPASSQAVPRVTLGEPSHSYTDGLGSLRGVRELSDGRILIADGLGEALIVWTPDTGADTLTNIGEGPGEYQMPDGLFPLPDDGTLLVDLGNARLVEIGADLSFGETTPIAQGQLGPGMTLVLPRGTDSNGRVYYEHRPGQMGAVPDSAIIRRFDPTTESEEDLAKRKLPEMKRSESGGPNNSNVSIRPVPLSAQDTWAVGFDGSIAVVRSSDYHVEWTRPDGSVLTGAPVPYDPVRVGNGEKDAWLEGLAAGLSISMFSDGGPPQLSFSRGGSTRSSSNRDEYEWPDRMPPFANASFVDGDGRAWVERSTSAGAPTLFDIFSDTGEWIAQVQLPPERTLVGFGENAVYLTRSDDFDFAWLERYETPSL